MPTAYHHIWLSLLETREQMVSSEAVALPFLIHQVVSDGAEKVDAGHTLYFGLLVQHQNGSGEEMNLLLREILQRLNFEGGGATQPWEPSAEAVDDFLDDLGHGGEVWRLYRSHPESGLMQPFEGLDDLERFAELSPLEDSGAIIALEEAALPDDADDLKEKLNLDDQKLAPWLSILDGDECGQSETPCEFFFFREARLRAGFTFPLTARALVYNEASCLPTGGLVLSYLGPSGQFELNGQPLTLGEHDLSGDGRTTIDFESPACWKFEHRFAAGEELELPWRLSNSARVTLTNHDAAELALRVSAERGSDPRVTLGLVGGREFGLQLQLRLLGNMPTSAGVVAQGAPDPSDYLMEYPTVTRERGSAPAYPVVITVHARATAAQLLILAWEGQPSWVSDINVLDFLEAEAFTDLGHRLTTFDSPLESMLGVDSLTNNGELLLDRIRSDIPEWRPPANQIAIPIETSFQRPGGEGGEIRVVVAVVFDLTTLALVSDDLPFVVIDESHDGETQRWDLGFFALEVPRLDLPRDRIPTHDYQDGTINLKEGSFALTFLRDNEIREDAFVYVPGGFSSEEASDQYKRRFQFRLNKIALVPAKQFYLQLNRNGLSLQTELVEDQRVDLTPESDAELIREGFFAEPFSDPDRGKITRLEIVNNVINEGQVFARMPVPGVDTLRSEIGLRVTRDGQGGPPKLSAEVSIDSESEEPVGSLSVGYFDLYFSNPRLGLRWDNGIWGVTAITDGELRLRSDVPLENGLGELRGEGAFVVKNIDLIGLSYDKPEGGISIGLNARNVQCSVFDGLVGLRLNGLSIDWNAGNGVIDLFASKAEINFGRVGQIRGGVSVGNLSLQCSRSRGLRVKAVSAIGFHLDVPPSFSFGGMVGWSDDPRDSYFAIEGELDLTGMTRASGLLRYGRGLKEDGQSVPAIAVYASGDPDTQLGSGLVLKRAGLGAGYNTQLGTLPRDPTVEEILQRIDTLKPQEIENWRFVPEAGVYFSIVGKLVFGSNVGSPSTPNGYILSLILSIDTNARAIAAGKMWLFSSLGFTDRNVDRPSLIGALKIDSREPSVRALVRTRRHGAIEQFPQLQQILDNGFAELAFTLSPSLLDVHLRELTYQQNWLGVDFRFEGSWRLSVWRETVLQYVSAAATGVFERSFNVGLGGFSFRADLDARLKYGGIFGRLGVATFGEVSFDFSASVTAYIKVEWKTKTIKCNWRKCWTDWIRFSERFDLPRQAIKLHLSGGFAFRANPKSVAAEAGVRFVVTFDERIAGRPAKLTPSLNLNGGLVDTVRRQVSHYEAQIDRAARRPGARAAEQLDRIAAVARKARSGTDTGEPEYDERWILFIHRDDDGGMSWVLIPTTETPWFTPVAATVPDGEENSLNQAAGFKFAAAPQQPAFVSAVVSGHGGPDIELRPAWDHRYWVDNPERRDSADAIRPIETVPDLEDREAYEKLYGQNLLLLESAEPDDTRRRLKADATDLRRSLVGYRVVTDPRPRLRSPDSLNDEDRVNLPADVYPFTYRPRSAPDYEDLLAVLEDVDRVTEAASEEDRLQNRAAVVREMIEDLGDDNGRFRLDPDSFTNLPTATFTPYVRSDAIADPTAISVEITRSDRTTHTISYDNGNGNLILAEELHGDLRQAVEPLEPCQEYRPPARDDTSTGGHVEVKLPLDLRGLFAFDSQNRIASATLFEILSHFRVLRKRVGVDSDFKVLEPMQVTPPIRVLDALRCDGSDTPYKGTVLLEPFLLSDVIEVPAAERRRLAGGRLKNVLYKFLVVPVGREKEPVSKLLDQAIPGPTLRPYIPPIEEFPTDVSMGFFAPVRDGNLDVFLFHAGGDDETENGELETASPDMRLEPIRLNESEIELWYDAQPILASGFYGEAVNPNPDADDEELRARDPSSDQGREERLQREAETTRFRSTTGRVRLEGVQPVRDPESGQPLHGRFLIPLDQLGVLAKRRRLAFQFYIRSADSRSELLVELPQFVFARDEKSLSGDARPREIVHPRRLSVGRVELYGETPTLAPLGTAVASAVEATPEDPRHRAVVEWTGLDSLAGGIEIQLRDETEERIVNEVRLEVLDEEIFRRHRRDFSSEGVWELVGAPGAQPEKPGNSGANRLSFFWDRCRWFHVPGWPHVSEEPELAELVARITQFRDDPANASWRAYRTAVDDWWCTVAQFLSDPQNNFAAGIVNALEEMRLGLIALGGGLAPLGDGQTFGQLERDYETLREAIRESQPEDGIDGSVRERLDRARDVFAARKLLGVVELRRGKIIETIEKGINNLAAALDGAEALTASEQQKLLRIAVQGTGCGLLQEAEVRDALGGLGLEGAVTDAEVAVAADRFPMSIWFLRRLFKLEGGVWNLDASQGRAAAEKVLEPIGSGNAAPLHRFVRIVAEAFSGATCQNNASSADCRARAVSYNVAIQQLAAIGHRPGPPPSDNQTLVLRPHHSITITRDDDARRVPEVEAVVPEGDAGSPYFPAGLPDTPLDPESSDRPPFFVQFLHVLERLGFAVDVALLDQRFGLARQEVLIEALDARALASGVAADYELYLCRGRAQNDESRGDADVTFSFVNVVALPKQFVDEVLNARDVGAALQPWLEIRSWDVGDPRQERFQQWARWILVSLRGLRGIARAFGRPFAELFLELRGGRYTTIPAVRDRSRVALPLPNVEGQCLAVAIQPLSRYALLADWLGGEDVPTAPANTTEPLNFRPYYAAGQLPEEPAEPVGFALPDRLVWLTTKTADGGDSVDNLLTKVRTGHRGHVLQTWHRAIDVGIETGKDAISLPNILAAFRPSEEIGRSKLEEPSPRPIRSDLRMPLFENETAVVMRNPPYFFEFGMSVGNVYDAIGVPSADNRDHVSFFRGEPTELRCRTADAIQSDQEPKSNWEFPLVTDQGVQFRPGAVHHVSGTFPGIATKDAERIWVTISFAGSRHALIRQAVLPVRSGDRFAFDFTLPDRLPGSLVVRLESDGITTPALQDVTITEPGHIRLFLARFGDHLTAEQESALPDDWYVRHGDRAILLQEMPDLWMNYLVLKRSDDRLGPKQEVSPIVEVIMPWHPAHRGFANAKLQPLSSEFRAEGSYEPSTEEALIAWKASNGDLAIDLNITYIDPEDPESRVGVPTEELLVYAHRAGEPIRLVAADAAGSYGRFEPDWASLHRTTRYDVAGTE